MPITGHDPSHARICAICDRFGIERVQKMSGVIFRPKHGKNPDYVAAAAAMRDAQPFQKIEIPAGVPADGHDFIRQEMRRANIPYEVIARVFDGYADEAARDAAKRARREAQKAQEAA